MNYWEYIHVEELLALQGGFDDDESKVGNDEALFIVVHQIYELWFKLILRELTAARAILRQNPVPDIELAAATRSFKRVITIFEQATHHFQVMETLTTRDYLGFRDRLIPASGFQSAQMREIEIILGLEDATRIPSAARAATKRPSAAPTASPRRPPTASRPASRAGPASGRPCTTGSRARPSTAPPRRRPPTPSSSASSSPTARRSPRASPSPSSKR